MESRGRGGEAAGTRRGQGEDEAGTSFMLGHDYTLNDENVGPFHWRRILM